MPAELPPTLQLLTARYDPSVFELGRRSARVRLAGIGTEPVDVVLDGHSATLGPASTGRPDALLSADEATWSEIAHDVSGGMKAFGSGRLKVRYDLHLGVGFLVATADPRGPGGSGGPGGPRGSGGSAGPGGPRRPARLRFAQIQTAEGPISVTEAGAGPPVLMLHGLGATKVSFLATVAALAGSHRAIAIDLPGFGDSVKPIRARYDPAYFAKVILALLDSLELERAHLVGNSMGGRVAIEVGLRAPDRVGRLGLLAPSLAWLRDRPWAPLLRLVVPQLGLIQPTSRRAVESIVRRLIPGGQQEWAVAGIDEFLRSYLTPRGRAAFYAAARNIYLEEPRGPNGLWTRLPELAPPSLFIWGQRDPIVPLAFARHVREVLPGAEHLELACGHVPQLERPRQTHGALLQFFGQV